MVRGQVRMLLTHPAQMTGHRRQGYGLYRYRRRPVRSSAGKILSTPKLDIMPIQISIGEMKQVGTLRKNNPTNNLSGGQDDDYSDVLTCRGRFRQRSARHILEILPPCARNSLKTNDFGTSATSVAPYNADDDNATMPQSFLLEYARLSPSN